MTEAQGRFAEGAVRLSGRCALLLGWRPDEFWNACPAEVAAIFGAANPAGGGESIDRGTLTRMIEKDAG